MSPTIFDPKQHLSAPDALRLRRAAGRAGLRPGDFIETLIKRALFCAAPETVVKSAAEPIAPAGNPAAAGGGKKEGGR